MSAEHDDHGSTPAAWTLVVIVILGCLVSGIGMIVGVPFASYGGGVIVVLGLIVGKVMQAAGLGKRTDAP